MPFILALLVSLDKDEVRCCVPRGVVNANAEEEQQRRRADDYVEISPFGECCHSWNESSFYSALNGARYSSSLTFSIQLTTLPSSCS
jgi:hypothetical protein